MNERIKELMSQTLDKHFSHTWSTMDYEDVNKFTEKFTELFVEDVVTILGDLYQEIPLERSVVLLDAIRLIENRFYGVE